MKPQSGFVSWLRRDSANAVQFLRTVGYIWPLTSFGIIFAAYLYLDQERISSARFWVVAALSIPAGLALALLTWQVLERASAGLVQVVTAGGNLARGPSYSVEEAMIVRGEYSQARETLESRLDGGPGDIQVHLRLADLNARWLKDAAAAERWYLAARSGARDEQQEAAIANGLIDLYRSTGQGGRHMVELARFANRYPGTRAGEQARQELRALKQDLPR